MIARFGHQDKITDIDVLSQERVVTSGARDGSVRIWKIVEESQLVFHGHRLALSAAFLAFQAPATKAGLYAMVMSCFSVHLLVYFLRTCWLDNCLTDPEVLAVTPAVSIRNAAGSVSQYLTH